MTASAADVWQPVAYSADKWLMDRIPWALWVCAAGLAIVLHTKTYGKYPPLLAIAYLGLLGVLVAGRLLMEILDRSPINFLLWMVATLVAVLVVGAIITAGVALIGGSIDRTSNWRWWSGLVDPPINVFGWMLIYMGGLWIAMAVRLHCRPGKYLMTVSPSGLSYYRFGLWDLIIPWSAIRGVKLIETALLGGPPPAPPPIVAILLDRAYYERLIAPKETILSLPGSSIFSPQEDMTRMLLSSPAVIGDPKEMHAQIEARWQEFRDRPASVPSAGSARRTPIVHGLWSLDEARSQPARYLLPVAAALVITVHAAIAPLWR